MRKIIAHCKCKNGHLSRTSIAQIHQRRRSQSASFCVNRCNCNWRALKWNGSGVLDAQTPSEQWLTQYFNHYFILPFPFPPSPPLPFLSSLSSIPTKYPFFQSFHSLISSILLFYSTPIVTRLPSKPSSAAREWKISCCCTCAVWLQLWVLFQFRFKLSYQSKFLVSVSVFFFNFFRFRYRYH